MACRQYGPHRLVHQGRLCDAGAYPQRNGRQVPAVDDVGGMIGQRCHAGLGGVVSEGHVRAPLGQRVDELGVCVAARSPPAQHGASAVRCDVGRTTPFLCGPSCPVRIHLSRSVRGDNDLGPVSLVDHGHDSPSEAHSSLKPIAGRIRSVFPRGPPARPHFPPKPGTPTSGRRCPAPWWRGRHESGS
jgi:hypothetical protein